MAVSAQPVPGAADRLAHPGSEVLGCATLHEMFQTRVRISPSREAYRQFDPKRQMWVAYSWEEMRVRVMRWREALRCESLPRGARVAILLPNGTDYVCADQAAISLGLVPVPLHVIDNPENLAYVIADSGAAVLLVESAERWHAIRACREGLPDLKRVVYVGASAAEADDGMALAADAWLARGEGCRPGAGSVSAPILESDLVAIVYTSGTTGRPKGVMLSHRNVVSNIRAIMAAIPVYEGDLFLSFLPLSHMFERTVGYYLPLAAGAAVVYARSVALLMADLTAIRPTILVSVPRIYERAHAALQGTVGRSRLKRWLLQATVQLGWLRFCHLQGRAPNPSLGRRMALRLLDRLVGGPVRDRFGGQLRVAVTGGAPMSPQIARPLLALGVPIVQGYGMTETAPVLTCNSPEDNEPESVGRPLSGVSLRIGANQEVLVRGPNVMAGYWQREQETARVLEHDGWLHTGDQGRIANGRLYIQGRLKDIIVTSTGEKVAPVDLETALTGDPSFDQALVLGERRPFLTALLVLNPQGWQRQAAALGVDPNESACLGAPVVLRWALDRIGRALQGFPRHATPRAVLLTLEPWTVSAGLITPTLKPKRAAIEAHYRNEIEMLYRGH